MKKLFTIAILVGAALLSTRWSHTPNENRKTDVVHSERVLELAKTEDGRLDLSILLASSRLPAERKKAFLDADEDKDGCLTQGEFSLSIPRSQAVPDGDGKKEYWQNDGSIVTKTKAELDEMTDEQKEELANAAVGVTLKNGSKHYSITDIKTGLTDAEKLYPKNNNAIDVPNAQALFLMSLMVNSGMCIMSNYNTATYTSGAIGYYDVYTDYFYENEGNGTISAIL